MKRKSLVLALCIMPMLVCLGCGSVETVASASDAAVPAAFEYDGSIISGLLDRIIASPNKVETYPVQITSAELVRQGCLIHYDKLAYNDNYVRGSSDPAESYLINDETLDEQTAVYNAYLSCAKLDTPYLDKTFVEYIKSKKNGAPFTLYWLDGQVIFVSEIIIP